MAEKRISEMQGHWVMVILGKKVLRPGGRQLTHKMLQALNITPDDDIVEFAPGLGYTARLTCEQNPHSYTAVELNEAAAAIVRKNVANIYPDIRIIIGSAASTSLPDACATKVYGEAMLTMGDTKAKQEIINEASRILKPGGLYAIHEMGLRPDNLDQETKQQIYKDLSHNVKVNARPLTRGEWTTLLQNAGFEIQTTIQNDMLLLEPCRMINDEGICGFIKILWRMLLNKEARKRIINMKRAFKKHAPNINAITIIARKK